MSMENDYSKCPVEFAIDMMKGKWKILIIWYLQYRTRRYNELLRLMPRVSKKVMTQQLKELEADGIIRREDFAENPPRVEYYLTPMGEKCIPILQNLYEWGEQLQSQSCTDSSLPLASSGNETVFK